MQFLQDLLLWPVNDASYLCAKVGRTNYFVDCVPEHLFHLCLHALIVLTLIEVNIIAVCVHKKWHNLSHSLSLHIFSFYLLHCLNAQQNGTIETEADGQIQVIVIL